jgi:hypothetical protein
MLVARLKHAKCPRCLREDLADWDEPYAYPDGFPRWLLKVGAKAHRCPACRVNFVSFRSRGGRFMPSWRLRQQRETVLGEVSESDGPATSGLP